MKLIKLTNEHYIIVDESDIKEGDYKYCPMDDINKIHQQSGEYYDTNEFKITHSTQPLTAIDFNNSTDEEQVAYFNFINGYTSIKPLSLQEVKELIGEVDVEKKAEEVYPQTYYSGIYIDGFLKVGYVKGYNQAIEDNKNKKYTEKDLKDAVLKSLAIFSKDLNTAHVPKIMESFKPKTEWEVEFVDGKIKLI